MSSTKVISAFGVDSITSHAWSPDGKSVAMSHNNKEVKIYKEAGQPGKWNETATLGSKYFHNLMKKSVSNVIVSQ